MASVELKQRKGGGHKVVRLWFDRSWTDEYVDNTFIDDDYVVTVTEEAARSLYKELGEIFAENTNES